MSPIAETVTLAVDTSTNHGSLAILRGQNLLVERTWQREKSHSEVVTQFLEDALVKMGLATKDIELLAVGVGPGSFTGIRVAVNLIRTLAFANQCPVRSLDTLSLLAENVPLAKGRLLAIINAHKNLFYSAFFEAQNDGWKMSRPISALSVDELSRAISQPILCVGDGYDELSLRPPSHEWNELQGKLLRDPAFSDWPLAQNLGRWAQGPAASTPPLDWKSVLAIYIRASGAEENLEERT